MFSGAVLLQESLDLAGVLLSHTVHSTQYTVHRLVDTVILSHAVRCLLAPTRGGNPVKNTRNCQTTTSVFRPFGLKIVFTQGPGPCQTNPPANKFFHVSSLVVSEHSPCKSCLLSSQVPKLCLGSTIPEVVLLQVCLSILLLQAVPILSTPSYAQIMTDLFRCFLYMYYDYVL